MIRDEFNALLKAFTEGYNDAYEEIEEFLNESEDYIEIEDDIKSYNESNKETKARNREIGNREIEKRFKPVRFTDRKDDEDNQKTHKAMGTKSFWDKNPSYITRSASGRVKNIRSKEYETQDDVKDNPYLDRTHIMVNTNKMLKNIKDPNERKEKMKKAKSIFDRLSNIRKKLE